MRTSSTRAFRVSTVVAACVIAAGSMVSGCKDDPVSVLPSDVVDGVYKIDSKPFGKSYAEWSAIWWQWAFQQPATDASGKIIHPMLDTTGENSDRAQTITSVYFLGGSMGPGSPITRTATIPSDRAIFFPIINYFFDSTGGWTLDSMKFYRNMIVADTPTVSAEVDGRAVANLKNYLVLSEPFSATLPDRNIYQHWGNMLPAGTVMPYLSEGYWLMLAPLSAGSHTIHFKGSNTSGVYEEATYNLTVR